MTFRLPDRPMPTRADVAAGACTIAEREAGLLLLEHGINPHNIPATKFGAVDTFTEVGYLQVTCRIIERSYDYGTGHEIETDRIPWPVDLPPDVVAQLLRLQEAGEEPALVVTEVIADTGRQ